MVEPAWKSLVESLRASRVESTYLDRLEARLGDLRQAGLQRTSLAQEILEEMAYALGRAEDKVNLALLELELASRALDDADDQARVRRRDEYNQQREVAVRARWELEIHREAIGFRRNSALLERYYPIPPRR